MLKEENGVQQSLTPAQIDAVVAVGSQLPSMAASVEFLKGNTSKILDIALATLVRTAEVAAGMYIVGGFKEKDPWRRALGGSLAVQAFIIGYALYSQGNRAIDVPSGRSAKSLIKGEEGAIKVVAMHWLGRSAIVGTGIYLAGGREGLVKQSLAGAAAIEVSLLAWAAAQKKKKEAAK